MENNNKRYVWDPQASFTISGREFALILNTFKNILNTEEAARIFLAQECAQIMERQLEEGIKSGIVKEEEEPKKE